MRREKEKRNRRTRINKRALKLDVINTSMLTMLKKIHSRNTYSKDKKCKRINCMSGTVQKRPTHSLIFCAIIRRVIPARARLLNKKRDRTVCVAFCTLTPFCTVYTTWLTHEVRSRVKNKKSIYNFVLTHYNLL